MAFIEPLDLQTLLINTFAGSVEIFVFIAFIGIGAIMGFLRVQRTVSIILFGLFAVIFSGLFPAIYLLVIVLAGIITAHTIAKIVTR